MKRLYKNSEIINDVDDVKRFISMNLSKMEDQGFANVLRQIIFNSDIEWKDVELIIKKYMPES